MDYASDKHWENAEIDRICRRKEIELVKSTKKGAVKK